MALGLAACGNESSDEAAIKKVMERHVAAIAEGDGDGACRDLTPRARALVVASFREDAPEVRARSCPDALGSIASGLDGSSRNRLRDADYTITVRDDRTATADSDATAGKTELRRTGDRWVITRIDFGG